MVFSADDTSRLDWKPLRYTSIIKYLSEQFLEDDLKQLEAYDYVIHRINCSGISSQKLMLKIGKIFDFPTTFRGTNLDAFNDVFNDPNRLENVISDDGGIVLALHHYDSIIETQRGHAILDIVDAHSRIALIEGLHWITLIQLDDPTTALPKIARNRERHSSNIR